MVKFKDVIPCAKQRDEIVLEMPKGAVLRVNPKGWVIVQTGKKKTIIRPNK